MGNFALRFEDKNRPLRRGKSAAASVIFIVQRVVAILMIGVGLSLGWMFANGDGQAVNRLLGL